MPPRNLCRIRPEILRIRMMKDQGRDGGFGVHHVAVGQLDADFRGDVEQPEEFMLIGEVRAGRIAEGDAHAAIFFVE